MNKIEKIVLGSLFVGGTLFAQESGINASLVGIEGGLDSVAYEQTSASTYKSDKNILGHLGLKVGAESEHYRVFLNGRYYSDPDEKYDSLVTYGVDVQYKFNFSSMLNAFVGVGAGMAHAKFTLDGEPFSRVISDPYYAGDLGVNIHLDDSIDLELGGRYISLDALNSRTLGTTQVDYRLESIITGYASIIFKYQLD